METLKAPHVADSTKSSSTTFQLAANTVHISTPPVTINAGMSYNLSAVVTATDKSVRWSTACAAGVADCGSIGADGTYTAPAFVAQQSEVTVKASSVADSTKSDSFSFTLLPAIAVAVMPGSVEVVKGFTYLFAATTQNDMQHVGLTWAVNNIPGRLQSITSPRRLDFQLPGFISALVLAILKTQAEMIEHSTESLFRSRLDFWR